MGTSGNPIDTDLVWGNIKTWEDIFGVASTMPAVPANTNGTDGDSVITIPAGYSDGTETATANDTDLVAGNIKSWVDVLGVVGNYSGWLINSNFKPAYYKGTSSVWAWPNNTWSENWACLQYGWYLYVLWDMYTTNSWAIWLMEIDLSTWIITEYVTTYWNPYAQNSAFRLDGTDIYMNYNFSWSNYLVYAKFDLLTRTWSVVGWEHLTGSTPTNSETIWADTFASLRYWPPTNQDSASNVRYSWFYIS